MAVKSILFQGQITSSGIVNFDGKEARFLLQKAKPDFKRQLLNDNVKVAKHAISQVGTWENSGDPKLAAVLKISKDCLRQSIFFDDQPFHNPAIVHAPKLLVKSIASPVGLLRGYMYAAEAMEVIKKTSPIYLSDAVQTSDNISTIDFGSTNMPRKEKENVDDESGTSIHYKETIGGLTTYNFEGAINLSELQFVSLSQVHDRLAVNPEYLDEYLKSLGSFIEGPLPEKAFFVKSTAVAGLPEEGIVLNSDQCRKLVEAFFTRLINLEINRGAAGRAWLTKLEIGIKSKGLEEPSWIPVKTVEDVMKNVPEIENFYNKYDEAGAIALYEKFDSGTKNAKAAKADKKAAKADKADKKKKTNKDPVEASAAE